MPLGGTRGGIGSCPDGCCGFGSGCDGRCIVCEGCWRGGGPPWRSARGGRGESGGRATGGSCGIDGGPTGGGIARVGGPPGGIDCGPVGRGYCPDRSPGS